MAREKRDQTILAAREEYAQTLRTITGLSRDLDGKNGLLTPIASRRLRRTADKPF